MDGYRTHDGYRPMDPDRVTLSNRYMKRRSNELITFCRFVIVTFIILHIVVGGNPITRTASPHPSPHDMQGVTNGIL